MDTNICPIIGFSIFHIQIVPKSRTDIHIAVSGILKSPVLRIITSHRPLLNISHVFFTGTRNVHRLPGMKSSERIKRTMPLDSESFCCRAMIFPQMDICAVVHSLSGNVDNFSSVRRFNDIGPFGNFQRRAGGYRNQSELLRIRTVECPHLNVSTILRTSVDYIQIFSKGGFDIHIAASSILKLPLLRVTTVKRMLMYIRTITCTRIRNIDYFTRMERGNCVKISTSTNGKFLRIRPKVLPKPNISSVFHTLPGNIHDHTHSRRFDSISAFTDRNKRSSRRKYQPYIRSACSYCTGYRTFLHSLMSMSICCFNVSKLIVCPNRPFNVIIGYIVSFQFSVNPNIKRTIAFQFTALSAIKKTIYIKIIILGRIIDYLNCNISRYGISTSASRGNSQCMRTSRQIGSFETVDRRTANVKGSLADIRDIGKLISIHGRCHRGQIMVRSNSSGHITRTALVNLIRTLCRVDRESTRRLFLMLFSGDSKCRIRRITNDMLLNQAIIGTTPITIQNVNPIGISANEYNRV